MFRSALAAIILPLSTLLLLGHAPAQIDGAVDADRVKSLPGYVGENMPKMWSGYVRVPTVNGSAHVHYWYVENSDALLDAPIVVWQQGGPGGSSLIGFLTEMGPLTLNDYSLRTAAFNETGIPTVFDNPWSWHRAPANYLFVEHPAPTGFSYCEGECHWDDWSQSEVNYGFYVEFFKLYPEL